MNDNFINYVEKRLEDWAEWYSTDNSGLGYPTCTIEYRIMTEGVLINSTASRQHMFNDEAEEIEMLVNEMFKQNEKMSLALRIHYFKKRKSRDRSAELDVSATKFRAYVDMAKQWLAGRLSVQKKSWLII